jgi:HAE1 family hydrophobic/amphiphilic exporter-1
MQWLARVSVLRPVFAAVLILSLCVAGLFSYKQLGLEQMPNIDSPNITVTTNLTGASAEEMDTSVTEEIEKQVNTIAGVDSISSTSSQGISNVSISFVQEKDSNTAFQEVQAKVNLAAPSLPRDAETPTVQKFSGSSSPVINFTLTASNASIRELSEYADKTLRPQVESVSGVGQASIVGGRLRQINITLDPYRLRSYNITAVDVRNALQSQNVEAPAGSLDQGKRRLTLQLQGRYQSIDTLKTLVITSHDGQPLYLRDVADVTDSEEEPLSVARFNGKTTVLVQVQKQSGTNTVSVVNGVKERLADLAKTMPKGYTTQVTLDQSTFIEASVHTLQEHLILGSVLAAIVVLIFLWDWRATVISSLAIPASIIATFALMWARGFTLNTITMLALTLSVGIVIDDAILVLENIYRFLKEKNLSPSEAAIEGTREIGLAVLATTLSLVAIFLPVAFVSGILGQVLTPFGLTMGFAIMVSMLVAFTLTPMLASRWLRPTSATTEAPSKTAPLPSAAATSEPGETADKRGLFHRIEVAYWHLLRWALHHRWVVVVACIVTFLSIVPTGALVNKEFLTSDDQSQFQVSVKAPVGTSLTETGNLLEQVATDIRTNLPDIRYTVVTVGSDTQGTANEGEISVRTNEIGHRKSNQTVFQMMENARKKILPKYPKDLTITISAPSAFGGGGAMPNVQYIISGPDIATLAKASDDLLVLIKKAPGVSDVSTSSSTGNPQATIVINRAAAADLGVSAADLSSTVQIVAAGLTASSYEEGGRRYDINLRAAPQYRNSTDALSLFTVPSTKSGLSAVTLDQVSHIQESTAPASIKRYARTRQVTISVNTAPGVSQQSVQDSVDKAYKSLNLGDQYTGQFGGLSKEMGKIFSSFATAIALSFIFVYLILAAQFESWVHPVTILLSLPLSVPFALLSLLVTGGSLNLNSMLGLLVLFGVVKKNSILQVDHANQLREAGQEREQALLNASRDRLRPILMTTVAFVAGMLPMTLATGIGASSNRSVGALIIGGQTLSLLLSLIATPVLYTLMDDLTISSGRLRKRIFNGRAKQSPSTSQDETKQ